jgi:SAM-dependent methyltransferase
LVSAQPLSEFVLSQFPAAPARVLEVGCGRGDLALALAAAGHDVTAIDPEAPEGVIFRRASLEEFDEAGPFDAVVARVSLHHIEDLSGALDRIAGLLGADGALVLEEFAKERFTGATESWYYEQREGSEHRSDLSDIHGFADMRRELDRRFTERLFAWVPYLYSWDLDPALEPVERRLIESGRIEATGFRYVGEPR